MGLPLAIGQKIKNIYILSKFHKQCPSFMLTKNYDNVSSNNEIIAKNSSAFLKFSKRFLNQRWPLSAAVNV